MTEWVLVLSNLLFGVAILVYFYLREIRSKNDFRDDVHNLHEFYKETITSTNDYNKERETSKDLLIVETFTAYLKHIQSLEKAIVPKTPTPITRDMVAEFMTDPIPNDIEKTEIEEQQADFNEMLNKIPITPDTKVEFEDGTPNPIEEEIEG